MNTILNIRVNIDDQDLEQEYILNLKNDISTLNSNPNLESLILRNADDKKFDFMNNLYFEVLDDENKFVSNFKNEIENINGQFFILMSYDIVKEWPYLNFTIESILKRLSLILNLSYNFPIDFMPSVTFDDKDNVCNISEIISSDLEFVYTHAKRIKWPYLESIELNQTINSFKFSNYSLEGVSKNDYQRAVNAFSHVFTNLSDNSNDILFWNMVGIEALLAKGNKDILSQIKQKSILILGEPTEFKTKLSKLYDFRSKFVHGELNFPAKFSEGLVEDFENEYWDYTAFSTSILLALIRELIKKDKTEFKFEYKYLL